MNGFERELNNRILAVVPHGESRRWISRGLTGRKHWITCKSAGYCRCRAVYQFHRAGGKWANLRAIQVKGVNPQQEQRLRHCPRLSRAMRGAILKRANSNYHRQRRGGCAESEAGGLGVIMIPNSNPEHKLMQPKRVRFTLPVFCS